MNKQPIRVGRRALLASGLLSLAGCTQLRRSSPFWGTVLPIRDQGGGQAITRDYVDRLPYASVLGWFEGSPRALLVLRDVDRGLLNWQSADGRLLATDGPFVARALGFDVDLRGMEIEGSRDLRDRPGTTSERVILIADERGRRNYRLTSRFGRSGSDTVELLGRRHEVERIDERISVDGIPQFDNRYWVDRRSGFCWKSRQFVAPGLPLLNLEVLKPAAA